jgi:hypothetical protein
MTDFPYVPLEEKGWRMAMGLRPLDMDRWLEVDENRDVEIEEKRRLLATKYDVVVATNPAGDEGSAELLDNITAFLSTHFSTFTTQTSRDRRGVTVGPRRPVRPGTKRCLATPGCLRLLPIALESRVKVGHDARRYPSPGAEL